jgi:hypothetical protein
VGVAVGVGVAHADRIPVLPAAAGEDCEVHVFEERSEVIR